MTKVTPSLYYQDETTITTPQSPANWNWPCESSISVRDANISDVVVSYVWWWWPGGNGTIDGQGQEWWTKFRQGQLKNTRPYLIEIMFSDHVQISNLTLINSPSWNVHPVYSRFIFSFLSFIYIISLYNPRGQSLVLCRVEPSKGKPTYQEFLHSQGMNQTSG